LKSVQDLPEFKFAWDAVRAGMLLARKVYIAMAGQSMIKEDHSPVTVADFAVQAVISAKLMKAFPGSVLVGEETVEELQSEAGQKVLRQAIQFVQTVYPSAQPLDVINWIQNGASECGDDFWTLDPIDGTRGYIDGRQYAVALAHIQKGKVVFGALGCPNMDCVHGSKGDGLLVLAGRGHGAWSAPITEGQAWTRLHVSSQKKIEDALIVTSFHGKHTSHNRTEILRQKLGMKPEPHLLDSQTKHALVAAGRGDIFFRLLPKSNPDYEEKIWDAAAGVIAIEEAGGKASDLDGKELDFSAGKTLAKNRGVLATNGWLHDDVLRGLKLVEQEPA